MMAACTVFAGYDYLTSRSDYNGKDLAVTAGRAALKTLTWRHGTKTGPDNPAAAMRSRFLALRIRPANCDITPADDGSLPEAWLLAEWPTGAEEPTDYWISTLHPDTPLKELVRLAKIRWRIEHDYRELKHGLGLDHRLTGLGAHAGFPPRLPKPARLALILCHGVSGRLRSDPRAKRRST